MKTTSSQTPEIRASALGCGRSIPLWAGLILVSGVPRILGAFLLPNAFGDAYSYLEAIEAMRSKMADGTFAIKDLHGFWLPMYQFICATVSLFFGHTFYVAKLVSALCGTGACLLVYQISLRLTNHRPLSLLAFALVSLNPLHILYSSTSMTDIPHSFLVTAGLYFVLEKRWKTAAVIAAAAGFMRIESWMLIALLPALQFLFQRRVSLGALCIMIVSPLFWFYICWKATGSAMAYFETRNRYLAEYAAANPAVTTFSSQRLILDWKRLIVSTNLAVLCSCLAAALMTVKMTVKRKIDWRMGGQKFQAASSDFAGVTATDIFFFSNLGFLLLAYFTGSQPDIWSRYGLTFFVLGLPVTAWTFLTITERRSKIILAAAILAVFAYHTKDQVREVASSVSEESAKTVVAAYLKEAHKNDPGLRIYCDEGNTRALTGLRYDRFLTAYNLPADPGALLKRFDEAGVKYVVCTNWETSTLTRFFPELREGKGDDVFRPVSHARSKHSGMEVWVYRFR
ncbi:MAG TPA: phospholipid carrier-dependent glycosyltransferase [Blastocatellia bacterium]|nr:phospholipid carrier-dependent glycosyltransferase [Blastocatellia bacterium]